MNWLSRFLGLRDLGILGMNRRNASCILDLNPRANYPAVDNKLKMHDLCRTIGVPTPAVYAVIEAHSGLRHLPRLLANRPDFVIKPNRGAGGRGIVVVVGREGDLFVRHNGQRVRHGDLQQHISGIISGLFSLGGQSDQALIQQRVVPDAVLQGISYQGTADIRVILYKNVPVMAMLRLPTRLSGGRANLHQGAIGTGVDLETGVTCRAVFRNRLLERHPDTGERIVGVQVPSWPEILDMARRVARVTGLGYLGVDIVLDRHQGPLLLEANARPGLAIQVANGQGLLKRFEEIDRTLAAQAR